MKSRQLVIAAVLFSSGWSSQVAYQNYIAGVKARAHISRNIASQESAELSLKNIEAEAKELSELSKAIIKSKEDLISELRGKELKDTPQVIREKLSKDIKDEVEAIRSRLQKAETFIAQHKVDHKIEDVQHESDIIDQPVHEPKDMPKGDMVPLKEIEESIASSRKIIDEFNIVDFEKSIDEALAVVMEERTITDEDRIIGLESKICSQNAKIDSLTSRLEELLKDKKKVVKEMDDEDKEDKEKKDKKDKNKDTQLDLQRQMMANMINQGMFMNPAQFFSGGMFSQPQSQGPDFSFLSNSSQMGGMDMNFLMLTSLLGQNTGMGLIGGRTNINYSPIYNNNQSYSVPSAFVNSGSGNFGVPFMNQGQMMQGQTSGQQMQMPMGNPFGLSGDAANGQMIPSFPRSNALGTNNTSTHQAMGGIAPNAGQM